MSSLLWKPAEDGWVSIVDGWFHEQRHEYRDVAGTLVPSCTQILGTAGFYAGLNKVKESIVEHKRQLGDSVHYAARLYDQNRLDWKTLHPEVAEYLNGWMEFVSDTGFKPRLIEHAMVTSRAGSGIVFGVTIDREGPLTLDSKLEAAVIEIKCTATVEPHFGIQLAGQDSGLPFPPEYQRKRKRLVVQLMPGAYKVHPFNNSSDYPAFLCCAMLANWRKSAGLWPPKE